MEKYYTNEKNALIAISLLKEYGIRKVIASPGTTNMALVASMQIDPYFEMYSSVDERSAAYMACGMAAESGEPVVISCTGATASRNYMPGMTEAFYRKLPVIAITSSQAVSKVGHHVAQVIDRSSIPKDVANKSILLPIVKDEDDEWECEVKVNSALMEITRKSCGPVHLNLQTRYSRDYSVKELPKTRKIEFHEDLDNLPSLPDGKIAILVGSHLKWSDSLVRAVDDFCDTTGAAVMCDHTSGYYGKHKVLCALLASQNHYASFNLNPNLVIHIGEVTGDYYGIKMVNKEVWRVSADGIIRDTFRKMTHFFSMTEEDFFNAYSVNKAKNLASYSAECNIALNEIRSSIPEFPFSNIWVASTMAHKMPSNSVVHFAILNSLRSWNFFDLPQGVESYSNVGGFGIDGCLSSTLGAALCNQDKIYFCVIGDLAFFYDMNSLGNRHLCKNLRILLINNGKGTEFRQYGHIASSFGDDADKFISASGHFGQKSPTLVKNYTESLGFEYMCASSKEEFLDKQSTFVRHEITAHPLIFEVFTDSENESKALEMIMNAHVDTTERNKKMIKDIGKKILGETTTSIAKKLFGK